MQEYDLFRPGKPEEAMRVFIPPASFAALSFEQAKMRLVMRWTEATGQAMRCALADDPLHLWYSSSARSF